MRHSIFSAAVLLGVGFTGACASERVVPTAARAALSDPQSDAVRQEWTIRDEFAVLSDKVPGFTGAYFDSLGRFTISATRRLAPAQVDLIVAWAQRYSGRQDITAHQFRLAQHDFRVLFNTFRRIVPTVGQLDGLTSAAIDERVGQIVFGGVNSAATARIHVTLAGLGVRPSMVRVSEEPYVDLEQSLSSTIRPIVSGLQISQQPSGGECSLGHMMWKKDGTGWVDYTYGYALTAAHCTSSRSDVQGDTFGQPYSTAPIGIEVEKALPYSGSSCAYGYCVAADIAVIQISPSTSFSLGTAALSSAVASAPAPYLGTQSTYNNMFGALVGERVTKVGRTTGQTSAIILQSCVDRASLSGAMVIYVLCSQRAQYASGEGDSGAPVFVRYGEPGHSFTPRAVGIHWGASGADRYFSPYSQIDYALGSAYRWY